MTAALLVVVFPFAMAFAAFSDLVSMTIPNRVPALLLAAFLAAALLMGLTPEAIGWHFLTGLIALCATFALFAAGWMGGGDAKLIAASAVWFGPTPVLADYLGTSALFGGVLTLGLLLARGQVLPVTGIDFVDHLLERDTGVPYGIALGAGGLVAYSTSPWLEAALSSLA
ncbi:prepilin peptidase [Aurantimonas sp. Leaf443]|uniref:A24 family peptidase n=1 Tax=Aurantimonas sp. Leaf443 TaxID=1736378 RepID=UPI000B0FBE94|nr:prepilin peptidase [Aurantimonas sp. Leaf443]